jgi:hypothetical protein
MLCLSSSWWRQNRSTWRTICWAQPHGHDGWISGTFIDASQLLRPIVSKRRGKRAVASCLGRLLYSFVGLSRHGVCHAVALWCSFLFSSHRLFHVRSAHSVSTLFLAVRSYGAFLFVVSWFSFPIRLSLIDTPSFQLLNLPSCSGVDGSPFLVGQGFPGGVDLVPVLLVALVF